MKTTYQTKKTWKELYKIEASKKSENDFSSFCKKNNIFCQKLDLVENESLRIKYLINSKGNCPDFLIKKEKLFCFVEVKTLTNFTNAKREKEIDTRREALQKKHQSGIIINDTIDFYTELWGPFKTFIQSCSKKFKNIKDKYKYPRLLLVGGSNVDQIRMSALFHGSYLSYDIRLEKWIGFQKKKIGLFDKMGSNISAVIYWNKDFNRYFCLENPRFKVKFSETDFKHFFS
ncbi:MAG: hypothetical protein WC849_00305 [Candidatus Paceibacterota bacterium]